MIDSKELVLSANAPNTSNTYIVANRLPVEYHAVSGWRSSPGGLVSALEPALQNQKVVWVGWRGSPVSEDSHGPKSTRPPPTANIAIMEVPMTQWEVSNFYDGICNAGFWPLYHDAVIEPVFRQDEFEVYRLINQRFSDSVARHAPNGAVVWVHDYHLQLVPSMLREVRPDLRIGFFLHVPFPSVAEFDKLPWKTKVLRGLLGADLIGFQTSEFAERFIQEACRCSTVKRNGDRILVQDAQGERSIQVGVFPVGPDAQRLSEMASLPATCDSAATIRADFDAPELILLGVDRLDYTKGIDTRIRAVAQLLMSDEFKQRDILFIQVAMPSRSDLAAYQQIHVAVEQALRLANTELVAQGLRAIHCIYEALPTEQIVALFVAADVMIVTSLADGMNLVSKEFVACCNEGRGRLVLSTRAGAAVQLRDAWLVEPNDIADIQLGIAEAIRATEDLAHVRLEKMRQVVFEADAKRWAESFLKCLREC